MNQLTTITKPSVNIPIPSDFSQQETDTFLNNFGGAYEDYSSGGDFRSIKVRGGQFFKRCGKEETLIPSDPNNPVSVVFLGVAPDIHCSWWKNGYVSGSNEAPDAVWAKSDQVRPPFVPEKDKTGQYNSWQEHRRAVVLLKDVNGVDFENPYVLDMSSASLYGPGNPANNQYKFGTYFRTLRDLRILPNMLMTKLWWDYSLTVASILFGMNLDPQSRQPIVFPDDPKFRAAMMELMASDKVQQLLMPTYTYKNGIAIEGAKQLLTAQESGAVETPVQTVQTQAPAQPVYQAPAQPAAAPPSNLQALAQQAQMAQQAQQAATPVAPPTMPTPPVTPPQPPVAPVLVPTQPVVTEPPQPPVNPAIASIPQPAPAALSDSLNDIMSQIAGV